MAHDACSYTYKKCFNPRTLKRDGSLHRLCEYHRNKANALQKAYATKRRGEFQSLRELVKQSVQVCNDSIRLEDNELFICLDDVEPIHSSSSAAVFTKEDFENLCHELQCEGLL